MKDYLLLARDAHFAGDYPLAAQHCREHLRRSPSDLAGLQLHALTDLAQLKYVQGIDKLKATLRRHGNDPATMTNLAFAYYNSGQDDEAMHWAMKASYASNDPRVRFIRGMCRLKAGDFGGWEDYEARFECGVTKLLAPRETMWNGEWLGPAKTLTLWTDQGAGDSIQMARFIPQAQEKSGAHVTVASHPETTRLFENFTPEVVCSVKAWQTHCPLFSLPRVLGLKLEDVSGAPYIDPAYFPKRYAFGLCWSGGQGTPELRDRSIPGQMMAPIRLIAEDGCKCLQYGEEGFNPIDFTSTAHAIAECNLVITIDTSVAHLAGAMGIPCWILLRYQGDFRWLRDRKDSPWYDCVRLYRQKRMGEWLPVIQEVCSDLKDWSNAH